MSTRRCCFFCVFWKIHRKYENNSKHPKIRRVFPAPKGNNYLLPLHGSVEDPLHVVKEAPEVLHVRQLLGGREGGVGDPVGDLPQHLHHTLLHKIWERVTTTGVGKSSLANYILTLIRGACQPTHSTGLAGLFNPTTVSFLNLCHDARRVRGVPTVVH